MAAKPLHASCRELEVTLWSSRRVSEKSGERGRNRTFHLVIKSHPREVHAVEFSCAYFGYAWRSAGCSAVVVYLRFRQLLADSQDLTFRSVTSVKPVESFTVEGERAGTTH